MNKDWDTLRIDIWRGSEDALETKTCTWMHDDIWMAIQLSDTSIRASLGEQV